MDNHVDNVVEYFSDIRRIAVVSQAIRDAIDWVLDGENTGRYDIVHAATSDEDMTDYDEDPHGRMDSFVNTVERNFLGFKVEQLIMRYLELPKGEVFDTAVCGGDVDIKWSLKENWMLGERARRLKSVCLLVQANDHNSTFRMGIVKVDDSLLGEGVNKDKKKSLSAAAKAMIRWIPHDLQLPHNQLLRLSPEDKAAIFSQRVGHARINEFCRRHMNIPFSRAVLKTLAQQHDPGRRLRADKYRKAERGYDMAFPMNPLFERFGKGPWEQNVMMSVPV